MSAILITLPCTARKLEAALHSYCDHHGAWDMQIMSDAISSGRSIQDTRITLALSEGSGETSPSPPTPAPTSSAPTNASEIRKMLDSIVQTVSMIAYTAGIGSKIAGMATQIIDEITAALAAPARNCDVGSPIGQTQRFRKFCAEQGLPGRHGCFGCQFQKSKAKCEFLWAQMTYKKEGVK